MGTQPGRTITDRSRRPDRRGVNDPRARTRHRRRATRTRRQRPTSRRLIVASFFHHTSRAGDPQLHVHMVVANFGTGPDGRTTALHLRRFYNDRAYAEAVFQSTLRHELATTLGYTFDAPDRSAGRKSARAPPPPVGPHPSAPSCRSRESSRPSSPTDRTPSSGRSRHRSSSLRPSAEARRASCPPNRPSSTVERNFDDVASGRQCGSSRSGGVIG